MTTEQLVYLATAATALLTLLGIARFVVLPLWRLTRMAFHFFDAWNGEPARDGLPARPGVVHRVISIEAELRPNGGGSMKDSLARIEENQAEVKATLEARQDKVEAALVEQAENVRLALAEHGSEVDAEFLKVWRSLASRDMTQAADHLSTVADRAERVIAKSDPTSDK